MTHRIHFSDSNDRKLRLENSFQLNSYRKNTSFFKYIDKSKKEVKIRNILFIYIT